MKKTKKRSLQQEEHLEDECEEDHEDVAQKDKRINKQKTNNGQW